MCQDAFTKTVPIWAAVLNKAVAIARAGNKTAKPSGAPGAASATLEVKEPPEDLNLPHCRCGNADVAAAWDPDVADPDADVARHNAGVAACDAAVADCDADVAAANADVARCGADGAACNADVSYFNVRGDEEVWDSGLHLPLWISENERHQIESRMPAWVERLFEVRVFPGRNSFCLL